MEHQRGQSYCVPLASSSCHRLAQLLLLTLQTSREEPACAGVTSAPQPNHVTKLKHNMWTTNRASLPHGRDPLQRQTPQKKTDLCLGPREHPDLQIWDKVSGEGAVDRTEVEPLNSAFPQNLLLFCQRGQKESRAARECLTRKELAEVRS